MAHTPADQLVQLVAQLKFDSTDLLLQAPAAAAADNRH
jgi:hypothetical protein